MLLRGGSRLLWLPEVLEPLESLEDLGLPGRQVFLEDPDCLEGPGSLGDLQLLEVLEGKHSLCNSNPRKFGL